MTIHAQAASTTAVLKIMYDEDAPNPRKEFDHATTMVCWHRRYTLGDEHNYDDPREFFGCLVAEFEPDLDFDKLDGKKLFKIFQKYALIQPLYLMDHGGIAISTKDFGDIWDSGQIGWVYITKKDAVKEYGKKRFTKKIEEYARNLISSEVKEYDLYVRGEVFGYVFEVDGEENDSCWGFIGEDHLLETLRSELPEQHRHLVDELQ